MRPTSAIVSLATLLTASSACFAQTYSIDWFSLDCGGATAATSGAFTMDVSLGQCLVGEGSAGQYQIGTGFMQGAGPAACYPNCDGSTATPILTANDFQCFLNAYASSTAYANCDGSTNNPVLTANDFQCFLNAYAAGCT